MQPNIRVMLFDEDGERFFGEGPCRLLHAIEQTGSLRAHRAQNRRQGRRRQHTYRRGKGVSLSL